MIRHVVCFKMKDGCSAEAAREMLLSMKGREETALDVEVGVDGLHSARRFFSLRLTVTVSTGISLFSLSRSRTLPRSRRIRRRGITRTQSSPTCTR